MSSARRLMQFRWALFNSKRRLIFEAYGISDTTMLCHVCLPWSQFGKRSYRNFISIKHSSSWVSKLWNKDRVISSINCKDGNTDHYHHKSQTRETIEKISETIVGLLFYSFLMAPTDLKQLTHHHLTTFSRRLLPSSPNLVKGFFICPLFQALCPMARHAHAKLSSQSCDHF